MVILRTAAEIAAMRESGRIVARTLSAVSAAARPGYASTNSTCWPPT
ncbi:hypothetical protein ACFQY4_16770 [Catellatospora bangladeshensis]